MAPLLARLELDRGVPHVWISSIMYHSMRKVKNLEYLKMPPKEAIHSKYKTVTARPGSNSGGEV